MSTNRTKTLTSRSINIFVIAGLVVSMFLGEISNAQAQESPHFNVARNNDFLHLYGWPLGATLTASFDDPANGPSIDFQITDISVSQFAFNVNFDSDFDVDAGHLVTVSDGITSLTHTVKNLAINSANPSTDIVTGTAEPGTPVSVGSYSHPLTWQTVYPDSNGYWEVDFTSDDLKPGYGVTAHQGDENGNTTQWDFGINNPRILSRANQDRIAGFDWSVGSTVTIDIDDPSTGQNPDKTVYATGGAAPWNPNELWFEVNVSDYDLKPGDIVTATDGTTSKQLTIENLLITEFDLDTEVVHGTADPFQLLYIQACDESTCANREETADQNGNWTANFAVPGEGVSEQDTADLRGGIWLDANINDEDGDMSRFGFSIPNPAINVLVNSDRVGGNAWPLGEILVVEIDDPATTQVNPDFETTTTTDVADWNPIETWFEIGLNGYDLKTGDLVTITGGGFSKQLTIQTLAITEVNLDTDTVYGVAEPNQEVEVVTCYSICINQNTTADQDGNWSSSFDPNVDDSANIRGGSWVAVVVHDVDGDTTRFGYGIPNPTFGVRANDDRVEGWQWPLGATIDVEIDDPSTQPSPDYSDSTTVIVADWNPNETWFNIEFAGSYDIKVGDLVTVTDGNTTKQHTVVNLNFTQIETDTERVFGTADSGQLVNIWTCWESDPCINRDETADQNGDWMTDFSIPGEQDWEQETADLRVGSWIDSSVNDEDGDATMFGLTIEAPPPPQCQPGDTVSGAVYEHDGVTPITSAYIQIEDYNTGDILFVKNVDQNGQFACSLPDGDYRIHALADNYSQEYFNEAVDTNAALVQVMTGTQLVNINFTLSRLPTMEHLTFNLDNALLQDLVVRQAISFGTNRQSMLNDAFLPYSQFGLVSNSIVPPEHWAAAPASVLTLYPYDPAQANAILEAAGWINRDADVYRENASGTELAFTFKTTPALTRVASAEIFRQNMEQIGIRITVEHIQPGALFDPGGVLDQGNFDITEFAWGGGYDDDMYLGGYITGNISNFSGYSNPAFDAAMASAAASSTDAERLPYLYEAQAILTQDLPIIPLFTRQNVAPVTTPTGNNVTVSPESYLDIHFDQVTDAGVTSVLPASINPDDLPPNFQLLGQVYDIGTSASFTGAQVCFSYGDTGLTAAQEDAIRLLHLENNAWVDVTDAGYPDTGNNVVCGTVSSFSPFAVMYPLDNTPPTITWIGTINDGDSFYFGFVPPSPTCTADDASGVDSLCTVTGYSNTLGPHTLTATASDTVGNVATEYRNYTVQSWTLLGFYQPVDMNGVYNSVKGGSTVPIKFEIFAGATELTDIASVYSLTYVQVSCDASATTDEIETTLADGNGLRYDAKSGQFIYNWKTPKNPGACYRLTLTTDDGSTLIAYFKLK